MLVIVCSQKRVWLCLASTKAAVLLSRTMSYKCVVLANSLVFLPSRCRAVILRCGGVHVGAARATSMSVNRYIVKVKGKTSLLADEMLANRV